MSYIGAEPIVSATRTVTEISATAGQTTFTANGGYTVGKVDVIVNGSQLQSSDFTATNGSTVVLTSACAAGDDVKLVAWGTFSVAGLATVATTGSASDLTTGTLAHARLPAGSVLQVVQGTYAVNVSSTTATYVDTGLTATITPKFSTSKILVLVNQNGVAKSSASSADVGLKLVRNGTDINNIALTWGYGPASILLDNTISTCYLDSPATTSAVAYKTQFKNSDAGGTVYVQYNSSLTVSTITLMEIAA